MCWAPLASCMAYPHECSTLGRCPDCGTELPAESLVVRYEPEDGWPQMLALCGDCDEIVLPV